tara:strand:+ start:82 stop:1290 length:1209 start_codon:yes stop_codon:yes gene_type:complete
MGLDVDGTNAGDDFGHAVALSADGLVLAVGAKSADPGGLDSAGTAAVYDWNSGNNQWARRLPLDRFDGTDAWAHWGESVALSADGAIVAVGAMRSDFEGKSDVGHVEVHEWNNGAWTQLGTDVEGERTGDYGGRSVALSADGHVFAVGATLNDPTIPTTSTDANAGHVRVYAWDNSQWNQRGGDFDGTNINDGQIGMSVALNADGSVLAIAAPGFSSSYGRVRVHAWDNGAWNQLGADGQLDGAATSSQHGVSMALSADGATIAIGDSMYDVPGQSAGCVRVYTYDSGNNQWTQRGQDAQMSGNSANKFVGKAVAISADGTIVAFTESDGTRVHAWDGTAAWTEVGTVLAAEAPHDYSYDTMGSLAMSADGTILAVGATENSDGGNGPDAGHVRTYEVQYHA